MLEKKIRRYKLMDAHRELVRTGKLYEAYLVLKLLRKGKLKLYLGDADWNVEKLCEDLGCKFGYNSRGYTARVIQIHSNYYEGNTSQVLSLFLPERSEGRC